MILQSSAVRASTAPLRRLVALALSLMAALPAFSVDFTFSGKATVTSELAKTFHVEGSAAISHREGPFSLTWELMTENRGIYPAPFMGSFFGDFTVDTLNAGVAYNAGPLEFYLGKLPLRDEVDSPYSLFINGLSPSVVTGGYSFDSKTFSFSNRWIGLDRNVLPGLYRSTAAGIYAERGAVVKDYVLKFGNFRFGYQDALLFTGNYFDIDYFANPAPSFFVQYVLLAAGRPNSRTGNQNSLMGFFGDYAGEGWKAYAQILVDDFNMNRFLNPSDYQNPDKIAWAFGGSLDLPLGTLGLHTAGATKYTFESGGSSLYYSYTLHAGSAIYSDGTLVSVPLEDQMLGYVHGENNIAAMAVWSADLAGTSVQVGLEGVATGSQSPTNPWHGAGNWTPSLGSTQLLNDASIELKLLLDLRLSRKIGDFTVFLQGKGGYIANRLTPDYSAHLIGATYLEPVYKATGSSGPAGELSLGCSWKVSP